MKKILSFDKICWYYFAKCSKAEGIMQYNLLRIVMRKNVDILPKNLYFISENLATAECPYGVFLQRRSVWRLSRYSIIWLIILLKARRHRGIGRDCWLSVKFISLEEKEWLDHLVFHPPSDWSFTPSPHPLPLSSTEGRANTVGGKEEPHFMLTDKSSLWIYLISSAFTR